MRRVAVLAAALLGFPACVELGLFDDTTSISRGRPSHGKLIGGTRLPDRGEGFVTRDVWQQRGNRYGTDEMIDLLIGVGRRIALDIKDVRLVVADLSGNGGGAQRLWHRSHQSGRDVDLVYFMRDAEGKPFEADAMRRFDRFGRAIDGSGITVDIPRTWILVKALLTAREAPVQYIFMYQPIANMMIDHATKLGEASALIERARRACRQPNDSARHDDHMHVRIYCAPADRAIGCIDIGPMELLAQYEAESSPDDQLAELAVTLRGPASAAGAPPVFTAPSVTAPADRARELESFSRLLRTRSDRVYLRRWR
ncbi:MAG: penicillin-insensitive murein endopeptidase [Kofleriaceae bacterium]